MQRSERTDNSSLVTGHYGNNDYEEPYQTKKGRVLCNKIPQTILAYLTKSDMSFCHHWAMIIASFFSFILINSSDTTEPFYAISDVLRWSYFRTVSHDPSQLPRWPPLLKIRQFGKKSCQKLSSLKLLGKLGPHYSGIIFRWSLLELCPTPLVIFADRCYYVTN